MYARMGEVAAQPEKNLRLLIISLESSFTAERNFFVRLEKNCLDGAVEERGVFVDRQEAYDAVRGQLKESEEALYGVQARLLAVTSELGKCRLRANKLEKELTVARAGSASQSSLRRASRNIGRKEFETEIGAVTFRAVGRRASYAVQRTD